MKLHELEQEYGVKTPHWQGDTSPDSQSNKTSPENGITVERSDGREKVSANDLDNHREGKWVDR